MPDPEHTNDSCAASPELWTRLRTGDTDARHELYDLTYTALHRLAEQRMRSESDTHTLQPTALVNEVFLRLDIGRREWHDRRHFLRTAAVAMRRILVDHARRKQAAKRSPDRPDEMDFVVSTFADRALDLMELDVALAVLRERDEGAAELVDLHFFGGQTMKECADLLGITERQVYRRWKFARAFLHRQLDETA